ncbi:competence protein ComK [Virgibacillus subterraneus]|uniref:competence protein ComK n=1 Tax=Virgibacillus subterraneus TaxID=621109 RepID=UPI002481CDB1|nr:competence protein ComK [Virgibacillus subterraneus]
MSKTLFPPNSPTFPSSSTEPTLIVNKVLLSYQINQDTMALLPVAHADYSTIVIERNQQLFVKKTPWQLIQLSCLENCSTYEGRRAAVMYHMGIKRKVPIPINPSKNLFTFPTHSPTEFECNWIFYSHIQDIRHHPSFINNHLSILKTLYSFG